MKPAALAESDALHARIEALIRAHPLRTQSLLDPQGRRIWVKTPIPARLRALYRVLNGLAVACGMPYFQAPPHAGGLGGQAALTTEEARLRDLGSAGVPVPSVVASAPGWLALSDVGTTDLDNVLGHISTDQRLRVWNQGLDAIADVHRKGCCLSQCFARNMVLEGDGVSAPRIHFIDFEEAPTKVMTLAQAQARDWAFYLHSTAWRVSDTRAQASEILRKILYAESPEIRSATLNMLRKLSWLRGLRYFLWVGRDATRLHALGSLATDIVRATDASTETGS